jgi:hypothetical protein
VLEVNHAIKEMGGWLRAKPGLGEIAATTRG